MVQYYAAMYNNNSSMRNVHLFSGHVAYVYWIDTVYFQNNLSAQFSKMTIFISQKKKKLKKTVIFHD